MEETLEILIREPKMDPWYQARLLWAMEFQPKLIQELWQEGPEALHKYLMGYAEAGNRAEYKLRKGTALADDQIMEIVQNLIAPTNVDPEKGELPEEIEEQIMNWAEM